jgi:hypothetical protein
MPLPRVVCMLANARTLPKASAMLIMLVSNNGENAKNLRKVWIKIEQSCSKRRDVI